MVAGPNLAVIDHTNGATDAPAEIARGDWDVVLLQQGPTPAGICRDTLIIAAMRLAPAIRAAGGRPALFLPWARSAFPQSLDWAAESATAAARAVGGAVVPIGVAWRKALDADPDLPLYAGDGYHPAPAGTLLAALTTYDRVDGQRRARHRRRRASGDRLHRPHRRPDPDPRRRGPRRQHRVAAGPRHARPRGHDKSGTGGGPC